MITFKTDQCLHVVESFDEKTETETACDETFKAGEYVDADIVTEEDGRCELQFGDGSVTYGVPRNVFDVL